MGERRWRATAEAGLTTIPAIVRDTDDDAMLRDALLENLHRSQLNPLEEAAAYQQLLDDFGCTHEELADRIGRSRPQISNTLRLLKLPPPSSGEWPPACSRPATPGPCWPSPTRRSRTGSPAAWSPRASRCAGSRRSSSVGDDASEPHADAAGPADGSRPRRDRRPAQRPARHPGAGAAGQEPGQGRIDFASLQDLQRIVGIIDPDER